MFGVLHKSVRSSASHDHVSSLIQSAREVELKAVYELPSLALLNGTTWGMWIRLSTSVLGGYGSPVKCPRVSSAQCE